jgi:membrane fusion protein (multidrug efflux system)
MSSTLERPAEEEARPEPALPNAPAPQPAARTPFPWVKTGLGAAAVAVVLYLGGHWLFYDRFRVTTDDAYVDTDQVMVMSRISERVAAVLVDANQEVRRGQLLVVLEDTNERARLALAHDTFRSQQAAALAATRAADLERELQSAETYSLGGSVDLARRDTAVAASQAAAAEQAVAASRAEVGAARSAVAVAEAALPGAARALRQAEADRARTLSLGAQGYVSASAVDAAQTAVAQARSAYDAARATARTAQVNVRQAEAKLAQAIASAAAARAASTAALAQVPIAQGKLQQSAAPSRVPDKRALAEAAAATASASDAQVRLAQLDLDATRIVAPVDGRVSSRDVEVGQTVAPGQALVTIAPAHRIFVTANYKETQMTHVRLGAPAEITVDACGGERFRGTVVGINPVAQSALSTLPTLTAPSNFVKVPQRIPVRISLPSPSPACVFRPGMSVETAVLLK